MGRSGYLLSWPSSRPSRRGLVYLCDYGHEHRTAEAKERCENPGPRGRKERTHKPQGGTR